MNEATADAESVVDPSLLLKVVDALADISEPDSLLAPLCTYRVGGSAACVITAESVEVLQLVGTALSQVPVGSVPVLVIGRGSNLLVADAGFPGVVVRLGGAFEDIRIDAARANVVAGGAALLPVVARKTAAAGLTGFEWAVGVPGSIGGAVRMNAGGHGADMASDLESATIFDLHSNQLFTLAAAELALGYRRSDIASHQVVVAADIALEHGDRARSEELISEIVRWRRANQPGGQNAGSVFANPEGDSAGRLIDAAGLKGLRIGSAQVSTKHANFIQADPDGSADDVQALIREVQRRVRETTGVVLRPENVLVGFDRGSEEE